MKRTLAAVLICAVLLGIFCVPISASSGSLVSMEVVKGPDKSEYIVGEYIDLRGTVVKLTYDNGDVTYDTLEEAAYANSSDRYIYGDYDSTGKFASAGRQEIEIKRYYDGPFATVTVNVYENKAERLEISNGNGKELLLSLYNSDGTVTDMKALDFDGRCIATDKGIFDISILTSSGGGLCIEMLNESTGETLRSNTISECEWYHAVSAIHKYSNNLNYYDFWFVANYGVTVSEFDGTLDDENIDGLITYVLRFCSIETVSYNERYWDYGGAYHVESESTYRATDVAEAVERVFGLRDIDVTRSYRYDAETDTIYNEAEYDVGGFGGMSFPTFPYDIKYLGDNWIFSCTGTNMGHQYLELNEDLQLRYFNYLGYRRGDINSDYTVNITDLFALKGALVNGAEASGAVDVNGDYNVNISDLFELKGLLCG